MKLVWIRNDLRLRDNPALFHACEESLADHQLVMTVMVLTPEQWKLHHEAPAKFQFRADAYRQLASDLGEKGVRSLVVEVPLFGDVPEKLAALCQQHQVQSLWFNEENWVNERLRDEAVVARLRTDGIRCRSFANELIVGAEYLRTKQQSPYKVFTPWYRLWLKRVQEFDRQVLPEPSSIGKKVESDLSTLHDFGSYRKDLWPAGEEEGQQRLDGFLQHSHDSYIDLRDYPAKRATSLLSPYLANGLLSTNDALRQTIDRIKQRGQAWEESPWARELAWREFYHYLMIEFPLLCKSRAFRPHTEKLLWENNPEGNTAWQQGLTGYPIIDAAMRQLNQTGWMHNRLRMLVASFYSKLLLLDWRGGEQYFMQQLIDGDFSANNGGWQWSASTGCDASPWFRIFNPVTQSEKFDPKGHFIRKLVPELADLPDKQVHFPDLKIRSALGYPMPIVDYREARKRALDRFGQLSKSVD